jgi:hypothetical protein
LNYFAKSCSFFPIFSATSFAISVVIFDPMLFAPLVMLVGIINLIGKANIARVIDLEIYKNQK